jgi:hypothetical protein
MALVIVEYQFESPPGDDALKKLEVCLAVREVTPVAAYRSHDRRRQVRIFEAAHAEAVREAHHSSEFAFIACWPADVIK